MYSKTIKQILLEMEANDPDSGAGDEPDHVDHLGAAILSIMQQVRGGSMDPDEGKKKVLAAYKISMDEPEPEEEAAEQDQGDKKKKNATTQESRVFSHSKILLQE